MKTSSHSAIYYYNRFPQQFNDWVAKSKAYEYPDGIHISSRSLREEELSHIPHENLGLFHCALACTVLIDQVMYSHFKVDYPRFREMTRYPKIEVGGTNFNLHPWYIIGDEHRIEFKQFLEFFFRDLEEFFTQSEFEFATWNAVKSSILADEDIVGRYPGHVIREILEKSNRINLE